MSQISARRGLAIVALVVAAISLSGAVSPAAATDIQWVEPEYATGLIEAGAGLVDTGKPKEKNSKPGRANHLKAARKAKKQQPNKQQNKQLNKPGGGGDGGGGKRQKPIKSVAVHPPAGAAGAAGAAAVPVAAGAPVAVPPFASRIYPQRPAKADRKKTKANAEQLKLAQEGQRSLMDRQYVMDTGPRSQHHKRENELAAAQDSVLMKPSPIHEERQEQMRALFTAQAALATEKQRLETDAWANYKQKMPGVMSNAGGVMTPDQARQRLQRMQSGDPEALNGLTKLRPENHPKVVAAGGKKSAAGQAEWRKVINTPYAGKKAAGQDAAHQKAWNRATKREYGLVVSPDGTDAVIVKGQAGSVPAEARGVRLTVASVV